MTPTIDLVVNDERVLEFCSENDVPVPRIKVVPDAVLSQSKRAIFGRCYEAGIILLYGGSFQVLYDGLVDHPVFAAPGVLASAVTDKASAILLHELFHWKQFCEGKHLVMAEVEIEREARSLAQPNESTWSDLLRVVEMPAPEADETPR